MRRRTLAILGFVVLLVLAVAIVVVLRRNAPPESARLLPEADAVLYINVEILRHGGVFARMKASPEPEYQDFIRQTGFQFERDLDEAAFAVHASPPGQSTSAPRNPPTDYPRFSEVFIGKFDTGRGAAYFTKLARQTEQYRNATIFNVPHEGRTVRVALLGPGIVAVSNTETPDAIHAIIDRYRRVFSGPSLLGDYYKRVPFGSLVWMIARIAPAAAGGAAADGSQGGLTSPALLRDIAGGTTVVASLRFIGVLQLRVEALATTAERAHGIAENVSAFLAVFRGAESSLQVSGNDPDVKAALRSIKMEQDNSSAVLKADVPVGLLKKLASDAATEMSDIPAAQPAPQPAPAPPSKPSRRKK